MLFTPFGNFCSVIKHFVKFLEIPINWIRSGDENINNINAGFEALIAITVIEISKHWIAIAKIQASKHWLR